MMGKNKPKYTAAELRAQAEAALHARPFDSPEGLAALTPGDALATLNKLQVLQIELELQIEELHCTQSALNDSLANYFELYDLAPVGYCSVSEAGKITKPNLTLANLVGLPRDQLVNRLFFRIILDEDLDEFDKLKNQLLGSPATGDSEKVTSLHSCDLRLIRSDGEPLWVNLMASPAIDSDGNAALHLIVTDINKRKTAEDKLRLSVVALKSISQGVIITGPDQLILSANAAFATITGYSESEILGKNCKFLRGPGTDPLTTAAIRMAIKNATEFAGVILNYRKDGTSFYNELTISPAFDAHGVLKHFIAVTRDITARIVAEVELERHQGLLLSITENTSDAIFVKDTLGRYLLCNTAACRFMGKPSAEILGKDDTAIFPADQARELMKFDRQVMASNDTRTYEDADLTTTVGVTTFLSTKGPIRNAQGEAIGIFGISRDITGRKNAETELHASELRFRTLVEHSPYCIHEIDLAGRLTSINAAGLKMIGKDDVNSIQGMPYLDFVDDTDRERIAGLLANAISGQASEFDFRTINGLIFQSSFVPIANENGTVQSLMGLTIDITARKQAEEVDGFLAQARVSPVDEEFFPILARFLSKSLHMEYVCIDKLDDDCLNATTLTVWHEGQFRDNLTFALRGTLFGEVVEKGKCCYPSSVSRFFPNDVALQQLRAESYMGITLMSHNRKPIGLIAAIGRRKLTNQKLAEAILERVATRAAGELERLQAENDLRASKGLLRSIIDSTPSNIFSFDLEHRVTLVNDAMARFFGLTRQEMIGKTLFDMFPSEVAEMLSITNRRVIASGVPETMEETVPCNTHQMVRVMSTTKFPLRNVHGKIIGLGGVATDITERHHLEAAVVANSARFRAIIDASPVPMALNDEEHRITFLNPSFVRTFGYSLSDIPTLADWWPKAYPDPVYRQSVIDAWQMEYVRAAKTGAEFTPMELKIHCKDGTERFALATAAPLEAGFEKTHLVILYDISDRKQTEQSLKLAQAASEVANLAKGEFLANMSHEIRTPLTAILGFADILSDDEAVDQTPRKRKEILDTIKKAGAHLLMVINDILDLSKIEANKLALQKVDTPLFNVLHEVEMLMCQTVSGKGLVLSMTFSSAVPDRILSDPTRLRQILMNILGNAIKFTEAGTVRVTVGLEDQDRQPRLVIDIADTGPGMTSEQVQGLFTAFGQVDTTVTRKYGGTGLGLVISRRLAKILGGDVTLLYSELGKGTCFRIVLPIEHVEGSTLIQSLPTVQTQEEHKPNAAALKLSGRILLAEDGLDNQRLIAFLIRKAGATIETAENGRIALEMLDQAETAGTPFHLLLTDMQMPEMDGYSLASTLRARGSKLPIVALTAHAMADDRKKCLDAGCDDYLSKPIDKVSLLTKCAEWLGKYGGAR